MGNRLGQSVRNDRGIISDVHQKSDFDPCFAGQSQCASKKLDLLFLRFKKKNLFGGQICEAFIFLEYRI